QVHDGAGGLAQWRLVHESVMRRLPVQSGAGLSGAPRLPWWGGDVTARDRSPILTRTNECRASGRPTAGWPILSRSPIEVQHIECPSIGSHQLAVRIARCP